MTEPDREWIYPVDGECVDMPVTENPRTDGRAKVRRSSWISRSLEHTGLRPRLSERS